jgi:hypothetical protein
LHDAFCYFITYAGTYNGGGSLQLRNGLVHLLRRHPMTANSYGSEFSALKKPKKEWQQLDIMPDGSQHTLFSSTARFQIEL